MIELELPWPPSVNNYKKVGKIVKTKSGKLYQQRVNSNETKTYYYQVYMLSRKFVPEIWRKETYLETTKYRLVVTLFPAYRHRFDIDNLLKVLCDSLTRAKIIYDDSQIYELFIEKKEVGKGIALTQISVIN